ncbi:MAG: nickel-dependent lactate racemase [Clostridiaceae bacterium]|nr:nickel-dependent lactate racemase [Clostridiaceae bacterium]
MYISKVNSNNNDSNDNNNNDKVCIKIPYSTGYKEFTLERTRIKSVLIAGNSATNNSDSINNGTNNDVINVNVIGNNVTSNIVCPSNASRNDRNDTSGNNRDNSGNIYEDICKENIVCQERIVRDALENPVQSDRLRDLAVGAEKILVITSDHTRPVPSKLTLPLILNEIRSLNPNAEIKILIATGFHRLTTEDEINEKFGVELAEAEKENIIIHDSRDMGNMVFKGILPSGGELWLNSLVDWADLVVSEGFIEPHFFAGFSGGRKSILPGIASEKTVLANHCSKFIADSNARTGNLKDNPIHTDMLFAARKANLRFILNVVLNSDKEIVKAFAGHPEKAHECGCMYVEKTARVKSVKADIVITSNGGHPLDQNIYQAVKGMTAAEACVNDGGVIIMVAACGDGHGGDAFYRWFAEADTVEEVAEKISGISQDETIADQWEAQILARVLMKARVIMVTDNCSPELIQNMKMFHASSPEEALVLAENMAGKNAEIVVIPDGVGVIVQE